MILITVSTEDFARLINNLVSACSRQRQAVALFFTGSGVRLLDDQNLLRGIDSAGEAVACGESWRHFFSDPCPISEGSQTDHSRLISQASHLLSF